jgi:hypothetical protein
MISPPSICRSAAAAPTELLDQLRAAHTAWKNTRGAPISPARGCQFGNGCVGSGVEQLAEPDQAGARVVVRREDGTPLSVNSSASIAGAPHWFRPPVRCQTDGSMYALWPKPQSVLRFATTSGARSEGSGRARRACRCDQVAFVVDGPQRPRCTVEAVVGRFEPVDGVVELERVDEVGVGDRERGAFERAPVAVQQLVSERLGQLGQRPTFCRRLTNGRRCAGGATVSTGP